MPRSSMSSFSALWQAYGEGRLERALDLIDGACEFVMFDPARTYRGHDGLRAWLEDVRREWRTLIVTYEGIHEVDEHCVVGVGRVVGTSADGSQRLDHRFACVAEFRDGRLVRGHVFDDVGDALRYARDRRSGY